MMKNDAQEQLNIELRRLAENLKSVVDTGHGIFRLLLENHFAEIEASRHAMTAYCSPLAGCESADELLKESYVNTQTAAKFLNVKRCTLYSWTMQGKIPYRKVNGRNKFCLKELKEWSLRQAQEAPQKRRVKRLSIHHKKAE